MPQLAWNETEFLDFFSVEPTVEEYAVSHSYEIERNGLRLLFTVWQLESVIQASLFRDNVDEPLFAFAAYVRGEARFINDKRGRFLAFEDTVIAPNRFWYFQSGDLFDRKRFPISLTVTMTIDPDIRIEFVNFEPRT
jgi:hypothetical protein